MKDGLFSGNRTIRVFSGKYIDVFEPDPALIDINDIAHGLSNQIRFSGHMHEPYTVAQHCVCGTYIVPMEKQLKFLLHDASEAYLVDFARPIKKCMPEYYAIEEKLMLAIYQKFGMEWSMCDDLTKADDYMLQFEWDNLVIENTREINVWDHQRSKEEFLNRFYELI